MSSTFMGVALLAKPVELTKDSVSAVVSALPSGCNASLQRVSDDGKKASIFVDGVSCAVSAFDVPMPDEDNQHELDKADAGDLRKAVAGHGGQLVVFCRLDDPQMGQSVVAAAAVHLLTVKLGGLGQPVAGQWVASKRLETWETFTKDALSAAAVFAAGQAVEFPSRFWVSVQLTKDADKVGGHTVGLLPFTGYEVFLDPAELSLAFAAERLVGTVQYLFETGPVLQDGQTLGVTEAEKFRISRDEASEELWLEFLSEAEGRKDV